MFVELSLRIDSIVNFFSDALPPTVVATGGQMVLSLVFCEQEWTGIQRKSWW